MLNSQPLVRRPLPGPLWFGGGQRRVRAPRTDGAPSPSRGTRPVERAADQSLMRRAHHVRVGPRDGAEGTRAQVDPPAIAVGDELRVEAQLVADAIDALRGLGLVGGRRGRGGTPGGPEHPGLLGWGRPSLCRVEVRGQDVREFLVGGRLRPVIRGRAGFGGGVVDGAGAPGPTARIRAAGDQTGPLEDLQMRANGGDVQPQDRGELVGVRSGLAFAEQRKQATPHG